MTKEEAWKEVSNLPEIKEVMDNLDKNSIDPIRDKKLIEAAFQLGFVWGKRDERIDSEM